MFSRRSLHRTNSLPLQSSEDFASIPYKGLNDGYNNNNNNDVYVNSNSYQRWSLSLEHSPNDLRTKEDFIDRRYIRKNDYENESTGKLSKIQQNSPVIFKNVYYHFPNEKAARNSTTSMTQEGKKRPHQPNNYSKIKGQKKQRVRLTLSCPGFQYSVDEPQELSPISEDSPRQLIPLKTSSPPSTPTKAMHATSVAQHRRDIITTQPSSQQYKKFMQKNVHNNNNKKQSNFHDGGSPVRQPICHPSCLNNTKVFVSYCTCFCCLNALCYHCVNKDDVGYNNEKLISCDDSLNKNLRRIAIGIACIPCFPCLSMYPILNGALDFMLGKG